MDGFENNAEVTSGLDMGIRAEELVVMMRKGAASVAERFGGRAAGPCRCQCKSFAGHEDLQKQQATSLYKNTRHNSNQLPDMYGDQIVFGKPCDTLNTVCSPKQQWSPLLLAWDGFFLSLFPPIKRCFESKFEPPPTFMKALLSI